MAYHHASMAVDVAHTGSTRGWEITEKNETQRLAYTTTQLHVLEDDIGRNSHRLQVASEFSLWATTFRSAFMYCATVDI